MRARFVNVDRETPSLFPADLRDWLPENPLIHFIVEAIERFDLISFKVNEMRSGRERYPSEIMAILLPYCYAMGLMSSQMIEDATYSDTAVRYICGNRAHPARNVFYRFRAKNWDKFEETFTKALMMAWEMGQLGMVYTWIDRYAKRHLSVGGIFTRDEANHPWLTETVRDSYLEESRRLV
jgi:transposase